MRKTILILLFSLSFTVASAANLPAASIRNGKSKSFGTFVRKCLVVLGVGAGATTVYKGVTAVNGCCSREELRKPEAAGIQNALANNSPHFFPSEFKAREPGDYLAGEQEGLNLLELGSSSYGVVRDSHDYRKVPPTHYYTLKAFAFESATGEPIAVASPVDRNWREELGKWNLEWRVQNTQAIPDLYGRDLGKIKEWYWKSARGARRRIDILNPDGAVIATSGEGGLRENYLEVRDVQSSALVLKMWRLDDGTFSGSESEWQIQLGDRAGIDDRLIGVLIAFRLNRFDYGNDLKRSHK